MLWAFGLYPDAEICRTQQPVYHLGRWPASLSLCGGIVSNTSVHVLKHYHRRCKSFFCVCEVHFGIATKI